MKKSLIGISIVIISIIVVVLFTNIDEQVLSVIKIDTSTLNYVTNSYPIDSKCDLMLALGIEYEQPNPSDWYLNNFKNEREKFLDGVMSAAWSDPKLREQIALQYKNAVLGKASPEMKERANSGPLGVYHILDGVEDPECHKIFEEKYPDRLYGK